MFESIRITKRLKTKVLDVNHRHHIYKLSRCRFLEKTTYLRVFHKHLFQVN